MKYRSLKARSCDTVLHRWRLEVGDNLWGYDTTT